jgi:hypothetical protein
MGNASVVARHDSPTDGCTLCDGPSLTPCTQCIDIAYQITEGDKGKEYFYRLTPATDLVFPNLTQPRKASEMPTFTLENGNECETGCVIDGHWGNYGLSRLLSITDSLLGTEFYAEAADAWRESWDSHSDEPWDGFTFEELHEIADDAESELNKATPQGFVWHWCDGEFFLSPICGDDDCEDETCAHWYAG